MPDIVLFGATGYTGRLTAAAMVRAGTRPVLAGRDRDRLAALADELGGRAGRPAGEGDVLVSTVGPFVRHGEPAVAAAVAAGSAYLDSTGEPPFIRRVFEEFGPRAAARGCGLVTAFGYDYVPGNLAAALALRDAAELAGGGAGGAGGAAVRVDVGYFTSGSGVAGAASTGTLASAAGILTAPSFAWRGGRIASRRSAAATRSFRVQGARREGVSIGGTEHYALPRLAPGLRDVEVYLGWTGPLSRAVQAVSATTELTTQLPGGRRALDAAAALLPRLLPASPGGGPDAAARARTGTLAVAVVSDAAGQQLAEVTVSGPNPYELTADLLAWGARRAADGQLRGVGALGPVDGFGLDALEAGCASLGLRRAAS